MYQINLLYTLNLYNVTCQLYQSNWEKRNIMLDKSITQKFFNNIE